MRTSLLVTLLVGGSILAAGSPTSGPENKETDDARRSPHGEALRRVLDQYPHRIRELEGVADWWVDTEERRWSVRRPIAPGGLDTTRVFDVEYRVGAKLVGRWMVSGGFVVEQLPGPALPAAFWLATLKPMPPRPLLESPPTFRLFLDPAEMLPTPVEPEAGAKSDRPPLRKFEP